MEKCSKSSVKSITARRLTSALWGVSVLFLGSRSTTFISSVDAACFAKSDSKYVSPSHFDEAVNWRSMDAFCNVQCGATSSLTTNGCQHCLCDGDINLIHPMASHIDSTQTRRKLFDTKHRVLEAFGECGSTTGTISAQSESEKYFNLGTEELMRAKIEAVKAGEAGALQSCRLAGGSESAGLLGFALLGTDEASTANETASDVPIPYFVKLTTEPTSSSFALLAEAAGSRHRVYYVPNSGRMYELSLTPAAAATLEQNEQIEFVIKKPSMFKISPALLSAIEDAKVSNLPNFEVKLNLGTGKTRKEIVEKLNADVEAQFGAQGVIKIEGSAVFGKPLKNAIYYARLLSFLASSNDVLSIEPVNPLVYGPNIDLQQYNVMVDGVSKPVVENVRGPSTSTRRRLDVNANKVIGADVMMSKFNLTGKGITAVCSDSGVYMYHDQFMTIGKDPPYDVYNPDMRKVVMYISKYSNSMVDESDPQENEGRCGHGTHVCGVLAGSSASGQFPDVGTATGAKLIIHDVGKYGPNSQVTIVSVSAKDLFQTSYDLGVRIFSLSWGSRTQSYDAKATDFDQYLSEHPDAIAITAAGNDGDGTFVTKNCNGGVTMSPGIAKNVITVGASMNSRASFTASVCEFYNEKNVAAFSAVGPSPDGRIKPDIICPGFPIESAESLTSQNATDKVIATKSCRNQGTSQAAPNCAGAITLLYQWLVEGRYGNGSPNPDIAMKAPPSSLLKALLLHSGQPMAKYLNANAKDCSQMVSMARDTAFGDSIQGFGRVDLQQVVRSDGKALFFVPNGSGQPTALVDVGQSLTYPFTIACDMAFKAVLAWTDPMTSTNAGNGCENMLVNDLDLLIIEDSTQESFYPVGTKKTSDTRNNVEVVLVRRIAPGNQCPDGGRKLTVKVTGTALKAGPQNFSLVASEVVDNFNVTSTSSQDAITEQKGFWKPWMTNVCIGAGAAVIMITAGLFGYGFVRRKRLREEALREAVQRASVMGRISLNPRGSTARSSMGSRRSSFNNQRPSLGGGRPSLGNPGGSRNSTPGGRVSFNAGRISGLTGIPVAAGAAPVPMTAGAERMSVNVGRASYAGPSGNQGMGGRPSYTPNTGRASYTGGTVTGGGAGGGGGARPSLQGYESDIPLPNNPMVFNTNNNGFEFNSRQDQPWANRNSRAFPKK